MILFNRFSRRSTPARLRSMHASISRAAGFHVKQYGATYGTDRLFNEWQLVVCRRTMARYAALQVCFTALCRLPMCRLPETAHRHSAQSHIVARLSRKIRIFAAALNWTKPASWTGGHQSINQSISQSFIANNVVGLQTNNWYNKYWASQTARLESTSSCP